MSEIPQNIERFRNASYWKERFGDISLNKQQFQWTQFYQEFADKLLEYKNNREELMKFIHKLDLSYLQDQPFKGKNEPLYDICPFTVFGSFNRGITDLNRTKIAKYLGNFLGVTAPVPDSFEAIPIVNNQNSWFFPYKYGRDENNINTLWELFTAAIEHADNSDTDSSEIRSLLHKGVEIPYSGWTKLSMGLYWIRPWNYLSLDAKSKKHINEKLGLNSIVKNADAYFTLIDRLKTHFQENDYPVHSFPELCLAAKEYGTANPNEGNEIREQSQVLSPKGTDEEERYIQPRATYTIDDIIAEGCFLSREEIEKIMGQLKRKKNLILQGPPGTGKTWLARKLAYALMEQKNENSLRAVQFHPNLSYEDFVRGWRPSGEGKLTLADGPFLEMITKAKKDEKIKHVMVIEEINRGNPAQIFGEMLTLLEEDKRKPNEALELSYRKTKDERIHIPKNLYVIGTMNIADRSLALVDLALRRRFAFFNLQPSFGELWCNWVNKKAGIDMAFLKKIGQRLLSLNNDISKDRNLGPQFNIGHSYFTPNTKIENPSAWFQGVVESEIRPLLEEYWFDDLEQERADKACNNLTEDI